MPLITLTKEERQELSPLLERLDAVCTAEARHPGEQAVEWASLQDRIQRIRLWLFEEE